MIVLKRSKTGYKQDPTKYFDFSRFEDDHGDFVLVEGDFNIENQWSQFNLRRKELDSILGKKIVRLEFEEPNKYFVNDNTEHYDHFFEKICTLCPYTTKWLNSERKESKRIQIYFPFNENLIPTFSVQKKIDICYSGHIVSKFLYRDLKTLTNFNYAIISNSSEKIVNFRGVDYSGKLNIINKSKITLCHNVLWPRKSNLKNLYNIPNYKLNGAFKMLKNKPRLLSFKLSQNLVPQLKSRVFEAAACGSLILCKRDPFNVIEDYFEPNKEFIYYKDNLKKTIFDILKNYKDYEQVILNAKKKLVENYTTECFSKNILSKFY